jgi:TM2 domain-containing membrane protein YozV
MTEKSPAIAMILSFLFTGVGIIYLGNAKKGLMLLAIGILCNILGMFILGFLHYISILTWIVSLYLTYKESQIERPEPNYPRRVYRRYD